MNEYATRMIKVWTANTQEKYNLFQALAAEAKEQSDDPEEVVKILAEEIEEIISNENPLKDTPSLYDDILTEALHEADYYEVAADVLDE